MNYWYTGKCNEILVDMDKPETSKSHSDKRLLGAMKSGVLDVYRVEIHGSYTPNHIHALITLNHSMSAVQRIAWSLMFHSDIYRAASSIMRIIEEINAPDLLITPIEFIRPADYGCYCPSKHNAEIMDKCPVANILRGENRLRSFFGSKDEGAERIFRAYANNRENGNIVWWKPGTNNPRL